MGGWGAGSEVDLPVNRITDVQSTESVTVYIQTYEENLASFSPEIHVKEIRPVSI